MRELQDLWRRYKETGDASAREELILSYVSLVRHVAGRLLLGLPAQVEIGDLESFGLFGLLEAIERFDLSRGIKFETYAVQRVRGAILDGLRAETWARALKQKGKQMEEALARLEVTLGRCPSDDELAAALGITAAELHRREAEVAAAVLLSLEDGRTDSEGTPVAHRLADPAAPDPQVEAWRNWRKESLAEAIERLPEKERLVVSLFYYEHLTATEIARVLGLSVARISQLHAKAILRLRGRLSRAKPYLLAP